MGSTTPRFVLGEVVGRGPYGLAWSARETGRHPRDVLAEFIDGPDAGAVTAALRARVEAAGSFRHPFVARSHGVVEIDGRPALLTESVGGCTLASVLVEGAVPVGVAAEIVRKIARALHSAWDRVPGKGGPPFLVHGDLGPDHVLVSPGGDVKVRGLGMRPAEVSTPRDAARARLHFPSPCTAPEALSDLAVHATDVYALGAMLAHLVTGAPPSYASTQRDWHDAVAAAVPDRVRELTEIDALADLVAGCLSFDPAERPDARRVESALEKVCKAHADPSFEEWAALIVPRLVEGARLEARLSRDALPELPSGFEPPIEPGPFNEGAFEEPVSGEGEPAAVPADPGPDPVTNPDPPAPVDEGDGADHTTSRERRVIERVQRRNERLAPDESGIPGSVDAVAFVAPLPGSIADESTGFDPQFDPGEEPRLAAPAAPPMVPDEPLPEEEPTVRVDAREALAAARAHAAKSLVADGALWDEPPAAADGGPIPHPPVEGPDSDIETDLDELRRMEADEGAVIEASRAESGGAEVPPPPVPPPLPAPQSGRLLIVSEDDGVMPPAPPLPRLPLRQGVVLVALGIIVAIVLLYALVPRTEVAPARPAEKADVPAPVGPPPAGPPPVDTVPPAEVPPEAAPPAKASPPADPKPPAAATPPAKASPPPESKPPAAAAPPAAKTPAPPVTSKPPPAAAPAAKPPETRTAPAKAPEPTPPAAVPTTGTVAITGDAASVRLEGAGGSYGGGAVPAGSYVLRVSWAPGTAPVEAGTADVVAGKTVTINCRSSFLRCSAK